jgi:hypothetical protein
VGSKILATGFNAAIRKCHAGRLEYLRIYAVNARGAIERYNPTMNESLFDQVHQLSVEEQIELIEALGDNIVERNADDLLFREPSSLHLSVLRPLR